ncbi:DEAD/DEAH box helicase [Rubrivivax gelatinosus]|uniref:Putative nucleoside-triphosphatase n=1 Tax=Rubrivivax gelatinosus (strain NBRC 100245 / IL144) TaxID=983917 RepID=I0HRK7_RUBGI|nr:AAA domain-containing protein [Rubrivivax gelatinosus]BAL95644.1 putative nucleoside-triphosphatase [Rubrivivax gelatinosus IL144]
MTLAEIRAALAAEQAATPSYYDFKVERLERDGALWRVTLEAGYVYAEGQRPGAASAQALLDESLDGASAWWGEPHKGGAAVLAVVVEDDQLILQNASGPPPGPGRLIRVYPPRFLDALVAAWDDGDWAARALAAEAALARPAETAAPALTGAPFRWLRSAQRQALALPRWTSSFLWGPPGTGKTTTLGVLLAETLDAEPEARVLLLSTTNQAVDLATVAVDKALEKGRRERWREAVRRLGSRFNPALYAGREHLIPNADRVLLARLARAESERPSARDLEALEAWSRRVAELRAELRAASLAVLRASRLAAMTTARAVATLNTLRELADGAAPPFDLIVFDEASQVPLAQALALMPLGQRCLFAGDPSQLSPVQRAPEREARRWLGRSAFAAMPRRAPSVVLLDEQSRMAAPIGALVGDLYYDGALRVAADAEASPGWLAARRRVLGPAAEDVHVHVEPVARDGAWSAAWRGPVRPESADAIAALVADVLAGGSWQAHEIVVLTPFRAQRALIRQRLEAAGVDGVRVSTVHRAQGSEAAAVLFDPADGSQPFLQTEEAARLVNVALSRAQAKVLLWLSPADRANPLLAPIVRRLRLAGDTREALDLLELARAPDFPANTAGRRVRAGRHVGEVLRVAPDGSRFWLVNERSGAEQEIDAGFWRAKARAAGR